MREVALILYSILARNECNRWRGRVQCAKNFAYVLNEHPEMRRSNLTSWTITQDAFVIILCPLSHKDNCAITIRHGTWLFISHWAFPSGAIWFHCMKTTCLVNKCCTFWPWLLLDIAQHFLFTFGKVHFMHLVVYKFFAGILKTLYDTFFNEH